MTDDLFGIPAQPPKRRRVPGDIGTFLRAFDREHTRVFGLPYVSVLSRDTKLLGSPLLVHGLTTLTLMMVRFFEEQLANIRTPRAGLYGLAGQVKDEHWIGKARPDLPGFLRQIPNLVKKYDFSGGE